MKKLIAATIIAVLSAAVFGQFLQHRRGAFQAAGGGGSTTATASASDTANMIHRWVADKGVYETSGETDAAEDGDGVYTWADDKGSGNLVQATSGDRPIFKTGIQNGLPAVQFVSSDLMFAGSALMALGATDEHSVYIVAQHDAVANLEVMAWAGESASTNDYVNMAMRGNSSNELASDMRSGGSNSWQGATSTGVSAATTYIGTWIFSDGAASQTDVAVRLNEGSDGSGGSTITSVIEDEFGIGGNLDNHPTSSSNFMAGYIMEIRIYNVAHGTTARNAVEAEMTADWGL